MFFVGFEAADALETLDEALAAFMAAAEFVFGLPTRLIVDAAMREELACGSKAWRRANKRKTRGSSLRAVAYHDDDDDDEAGGSRCARARASA